MQKLSVAAVLLSAHMRTVVHAFTFNRCAEHLNQKTCWLLWPSFCASCSFILREFLSPTKHSWLVGWFACWVVGLLVCDVESGATLRHTCCFSFSHSHRPHQRASQHTRAVPRQQHGYHVTSLRQHSAPAQYEQRRRQQKTRLAVTNLVKHE